MTDVELAKVADGNGGWVRRGFFLGIGLSLWGVILSVILAIFAPFVFAILFEIAKATR